MKVSPSKIPTPTENNDNIDFLIKLYDVSPVASILEGILLHITYHF